MSSKVFVLAIIRDGTFTKITFFRIFLVDKARTLLTSISQKQLTGPIHALLAWHRRHYVVIH